MLTTTRALVLATFAGLALSTLQTGCSTTNKANQSHYDNLPQSSATPDDILAIVAERESLSPSTIDLPRIDALLNTGIERPRPGTQEYSKAHRALQDILSRKDLTLPTQTEDITLHPDVSKAYIRARKALLNEDYPQSIGILEQLNDAVPTSPQILLTLADAYHKTGDRATAATFYTNAVDLGDTSPRALVYAAIAASSDPEQVIKLTANLWTNPTDDQRADQPASILAGVMLGQALLETGHYAAGAQTIQSAMDKLDADLARNQRYRNELVQLFTRRTEQYTSIADAWLLLNKPDRALELYQRASSFTQQSPLNLTIRQASAHLLQGQSAQAMLLVLDWIDQHPAQNASTLNHAITNLINYPSAGDTFKDALTHRLNNTTIPHAHRQTILASLLSATPDAQSANTLLATVDPEIISPVSCAQTLHLSDTLENKITSTQSILAKSPSIAPTLITSLTRLQGDTPTLLSSLDQYPHPTNPLIRAQIEHTLPIPPSSIPNPTTITERIANALSAARRAEFETSQSLFNDLIDLEPTMNRAQRAYLVESLLNAQLPIHAQSIAELNAQRPSATAKDWMLLAHTARQTNEQTLLLDALNHAIELDPYDESIYEQLITYHTNASRANPQPESNEPTPLQTTTRALSQRLPNSALVRLIRAHELAGSAAESASNADATESAQARITVLLGQAERALVQAHQEHPWRQIGTDLLLSIWATQANAGDPDAPSRALAWIESQLESMPGSIELASAKARLLVLANKNQDANTYLENLVNRIPTREAGQLHEGLLRSDPDQRASADALALDRLKDATSINDTIERFERALASQTVHTFEPHQLINPDPNYQLTNTQALRLVRILGNLAQIFTTQSQGAPSQLSNDQLLALIEIAKSHTPFSDKVSTPQSINPYAALDQIEILALANAPSVDLPTFAQRVRQSTPHSGPSELLNSVLQAIMSTQDINAALTFLTHLSIDTTQDQPILNPSRANDLANLLGQMGTFNDINASIEIYQSHNLLTEFRDTVVLTLGTMDEASIAPADQTPSVIADTLYSLGVVASYFNRTDNALEIYRKALTLDPDHAWSNNDLGYHLVERAIALGQANHNPEELQYAATLLQRAHNAKPDAGSITDSLGWARYAQGIFLDQTNPPLQGALSLLKQAIKSDPSNATVQDHLGDAYWMTNQPSKAIEAWLTAEALLRIRLTELSDVQVNNQQAIDNLRTELRTIRLKITDAENNQTPSVAPNLIGTPIPTPSN